MPQNITDNVPIPIPFSDSICSINSKNHIPPNRKVAHFICEYMQSFFVGLTVKY